MPLPLMPKATAVWLIENTTTSFKQIAEFCGLHTLEVQGIADEEVAVGIKGKNPIISGELSSENITECEKDFSKKLILQITKTISSSSKKRKSPRYTPLSRSQDRPNAIMIYIILLSLAAMGIFNAQTLSIFRRKKFVNKSNNKANKAEIKGYRCSFTIYLLRIFSG